MTTLAIPMAFVAVATTAGAAALAFLLRDFRLRRVAEGGGQSQQFVSPFDSPARRLKASGRPLDRAFVDLIESCGTKLDVVTGMCIVAAAAIVGCAGPLLLFDSVWGAVAGSVIGGLMPILFWSIQRDRRLAKMAQHMPHALEALADCVRNGHGLEMAMSEVADEVPGPLAEEFAYCASQLKLGNTPRAVMESMARRVPLPEFRVFATAAVVHQQTGGNLALLAERLSASAVDRHEATEHLRAVTSGSKLSAAGLVCGALVGVGILAWIRPEYVQTLLNHPFGTTLLGTSAVLATIGALWIWRVLKISY